MQFLFVFTVGTNQGSAAGDGSEYGHDQFQCALVRADGRKAFTFWLNL